MGKVTDSLDVFKSDISQYIDQLTGNIENKEKRIKDLQKQIRRAKTSIDDLKQRIKQIER